MRKIPKVYKTDGIMRDFFISIGKKGGPKAGQINKAKGSEYFKMMAAKRWENYRKITSS